MLARYSLPLKIMKYLEKKDYREATVTHVLLDGTVEILTVPLYTGRLSSTTSIGFSQPISRLPIYE
jgi:hypothetical protein